MAYRNLREFLRKLEKAGELKRIRAEVNVDLEIAEITDRVSKAVGPALLFERPKGYGIPVAINLLGSPSRMNLALEADSPDQVAERLEALLDMKTPAGFLDKVKMLPKLAELGSFLPKTVRSGPCKEVIERSNPSLAKFPIIQCWPEDAGRFITFPTVVTRSPQNREAKCGRLSDAGL